MVDGGLTLGIMMSISAIIGQVNGPLSQLIGFLQQFQDARISLERSEEVQLCPDEDNHLQRDVPADASRDIEVHHLTFSYTGTIGKPSMPVPAPGDTLRVVQTAGGDMAFTVDSLRAEGSDIALSLRATVPGDLSRRLGGNTYTQGYVYTGRTPLLRLVLEKVR